MTNIEKLITVMNPLDKEVELLTSLFRTDSGQVLLIKNPTNITNHDIVGGIHFYIPLLVKLLTLDISCLIVVVVSEFSDDLQDEKYRQVYFSQNIQTKIINSKIVPYTNLYGPKIQPLDPTVAKQLQFEGLKLSRYIGKSIVLRTSEAGDVSGKVLSYDGYNYLMEIDGFSPVRSLSGKIISVA